MTKIMGKIIIKIMEVIMISGVLTFAFAMGYEGHKDGRLEVLLNKAGVTLPGILGAFLGIYLAFFVAVSIIRSILWIKRYLEDDGGLVYDIVRNWDKFTLAEQEQIKALLSEQKSRNAKVKHEG
jgi:hypothetical protein